MYDIVYNSTNTSTLKTQEARVGTLHLLSHAEREDRFSNPGLTEKGLTVNDFMISFVCERFKVKTVIRGMAFRYLQMAQAFLAPDRFPAADVRPCNFLGGSEKVNDANHRVVETYCEFSDSLWIPLSGIPEVFTPRLFWRAMEWMLKNFGDGLVLCTGRQFCVAAGLLKVHSSSVVEIDPANLQFRILIDREIVVENPCWEKQTFARFTRKKRGLPYKPDE